MIRLLCSLYRFKFNTCFKATETLPALMNDKNGNVSLPLLVENIRRRTWHKTIVNQNTIPTHEAMSLHAQGATYVLHKISLHTFQALNPRKREIGIYGTRKSGRKREIRKISSKLH